MIDFESKYNGEQVEAILDSVANGEAGGGGGGITVETDPIFSASPAASITNDKIVEWNNKVDKVSGKGLSTEDFTSSLKAKLDGLNNYDDTAIKQQIAAKQDNITDLETIRSGAAKGATALQNVKTINGESIVGEGNITIKTDVDTSTLATKDELNNLTEEIISNEEVHAAALNDLNDRLNALVEGGQGGPTLTEADIAAMGFTKNAGTVTKVKINGEEKSPNSTGIVDLGTISVESNVYLTDFTYEDLIDVYYGYKDSATCNFQNLKAAIDEGKTIVIPMNNVPNGYIPDIQVYDTDYYLYIHRLLSYIEIYFDSSVTSTQLDSGYLYSQEAQPILTSGNNIKTIGGQSVLGRGDIAFKTINGESIVGSGNIVISGGGGGSSSGSGAYAEVNHGTSDTTFALTPNTFHVWEEVSALTLTLGSETSGVANEYLFQFTSGATATSLTLPDDIKWTEELVIEPNRIYQISILKGLASVLSWENANTSELIENHITYDAGDFMNGGTITFEYPTASELTFSMDYYGSSTFIVPQGSTQVNVEWNEPSAPIIRGFSPTEDSTYKYVLS